MTARYFVGKYNKEDPREPFRVRGSDCVQNPHGLVVWRGDDYIEGLKAASEANSKERDAEAKKLEQWKVAASGWQAPKEA